MKAETHSLYEKLKIFPLDFAEASYPFSRRLRMENGWSEEFTRRVLSEYRRFLFLAGACGHQVAPPDAIDQAWHLHMVYTRSYWDELCGETLGFPLHHGPTRGGQVEADKFTDWYAKTLESYRTWFGEEPPADIWHSPAERFQKERNRFQRVNLSENWVIPKRLPRLAPGVAVVMILGSLPFTWGASSGAGVYIAISIIALLAVLIGSLVTSSAAQKPGRGNTRGNTGTSSGSSGTVDVGGTGCGGDSHGHGHGHGHGDSGDSGGSDGGDGGSSGCGGGCGGGGGD